MPKEILPTDIVIKVKKKKKWVDAGNVNEDMADRMLRQATRGFLSPG